MNMNLGFHTAYRLLIVMVLQLLYFELLVECFYTSLIYYYYILFTVTYMN